MNAVEIEVAVSELAERTFNSQEFAFEFLRAFGNKETTIKRLRTGQSNASDLDNGVLQRNYIHIVVCDKDLVTDTLRELRESKASEKAKVKFILATDGLNLQAEDLTSGEIISIDFTNLADHFGFFLPLAGISTIREIKDNPIDIRATGRLNKLYIELLKENPEWATEERKQDMNHFMARLIFCFFAEDTEIFQPNGVFTQTIEQMSERDSSNTHEIISTLFSIMNTNHFERETEKTPAWAKKFPYVNGGLFSGNTEVPKFSKIARTYLLHAGALNWQKINPDIFGSMIQAVTNDDERSSLGMHYTSVPNILKVLRPLFLYNLREQLELSKDSPLKLLNLRKRIARIRVFDPACGSGNFLVIAYKELRKIEAEINIFRNEKGRATDIPLTNFRGIEINSFPAEIARLALVIAEYQSNIQYCGQMEALQTILPLSKENWIVCGNALRLDWLSICPPTGHAVKILADDLSLMPLDHPKFDFENEGGETYICGNPPYVGSNVKPPKNATVEQKEKIRIETEERKNDLKAVFEGRVRNWGALDYVSAWILKAADFSIQTNSASAFVATNSICQGRQVAELWSLIFNLGHQIFFAHTAFKWSNLATNNAGVTVVIIGFSIKKFSNKVIYSIDEFNPNHINTKDAHNISPYLTDSKTVFVKQRSVPISDLQDMSYGNMANDNGALLLSFTEAVIANNKFGVDKKFIRKLYGAKEHIQGYEKRCIWVLDSDTKKAYENRWLVERFNAVKNTRSESTRPETKKLADIPHRFGEVRQHGDEVVIIIPRVSSENRDYLPAGLLPRGSIIGDSFALYDSPIRLLAIISSKLHIAWVAAVCGKRKTDYRYSNTLGWNTFPVPKLTEKNKLDLTRCAENILLARESHFPATLADLYDREDMPENLRIAHEKNDEVLERIYIGRRFKNDTERLEKLFSMYTDMILKQAGKKNNDKSS